MHSSSDEAHSNALALALALGRVSDVTPLAGPAQELVHGREGIGRLLERDGSHAYVEYFDHPGDGGTVRRRERTSDVRPAFLAPQLRVHWRTASGWDHGRVVEHHTQDGRVVVRAPRGRELILDEAVLFVRWHQRLRDATPMLADQWIETRRFHDARHAFVEAYLNRASQYQGITAIASAGVEAHPHQLEAVRRVLTDVAPRYLLADEVGLGKTIEAGLLVRQHLLDHLDTSAVVVVPDALRLQWKDELDEKFQVFEQFPDRCEIWPFSRLTSASRSGDDVMLVIDEAHRLTAEPGPEYEAVRKLATGAAAVLLLSATPLLQEPASLLRLLHLLAPDVHRLEDLGGFETALRNRDEIAGLYGNLDDGQPVFLRAALRGLREVLRGDRRLQDLLDAVDEALSAEDRGALSAAVQRARAHINEAHRLHSRMIRTRRGVGLAEDFPVLGRQEPVEQRVEDALGPVGLPFADWHEHVLARLEQTPASRDEIVRGAFPIVSALSSAGIGLATAARERAARLSRTEAESEERALLDALADAAVERSAACPRITHAVRLAAGGVAAGKHVAVATSTEDVADTVAAVLGHKLRGSRVLRISAETPGAASEFERTQGGVVLVFGPVGEEGQNLQAAERVIHVDVPWDANRLEQRLGRFDRFGAGMPCEHVVLLDDQDTPANAWHRALLDGFGVYSSSIASLQLAVERLATRISDVTVTEGADGLARLSSWVSAELEAELAAVEVAEVLDETILDDRGRRFVESVDQAERPADADAWEESVGRWASGQGGQVAHLRFHHEADGSRHEFGITRFENPDVTRLRDVDLPLVAWSDLAERFAGAMPVGKAVGAFRRNSAAQRRLRLLGPGDPFVEALWDFTEVDDRGRAFAVWRARAYWHYDEALLACFDLRVRPDVAPAMEAAGRDGHRIAASLQRRAESYFPPLTKRVWLTIRGQAVQGEKLLQVLNAPYNDGAGDQTIRPAMWHRVDEHVGPREWGAWCSAQRERAEAIVAERADLKTACETAAAQLEADSAEAAGRLFARRERASREAAERELEIGAAIARGLRAPTFEADAAGVVVMAAKPLAEAD